MHYIKPLDGLRTIAVTAVIISHWFPHNSITDMIPFGEIGVDVFFVISGFLITSILLQNKTEVEEGGQTRKSVLKNFIARRTLRIFPIYYITLLALYLVADKTGTQLKSDIVYYLTYTSNWNFYFRQQWDGMLSHLWSLAVEEQFYLVWPWVILLVKRKYLLHVMFFAIITGILSNSLAGDGFSWVLTTSCFDAFAIGALIAYDKVYHTGFFRKHFTPVLIITILLAIAYCVLPWHFLPLRTIVALCSMCAIVSLLYFKNALASLLSVSWMVFLGKISYGIYLYHNIVPWAWGNFIGKLRGYGLPAFFENKEFLYVQHAVVLITVSWLSWLIIEKPINHLKKNFTYNNAASKSDTGVAHPEKWIGEIGQVQKS